MSKLNLKQASLLDASGELSSPARRQLIAHISENPAAQDQYRKTSENFAILQSLPFPEPSASQRQLIPARIKHALHRALRQCEKQTATAVGHLPAFWNLRRYAGAGLALAACIAVCGMLLLVRSSHDQRLRDQIARINSQIDRMAGAATPWSAANGDPVITDVAASIRQLQTESPTLSDLHDKGLSNLLSALAALPTDTLSAGAPDADDTDFAAPGSY
jgi:anti-sigma factor RsiW